MVGLGLDGSMLDQTAPWLKVVATAIMSEARL